MYNVFVSLVCLGAKPAIGLHCDDGYEVRRRPKALALIKKPEDQTTYITNCHKLQFKVDIHS